MRKLKIREVEHGYAVEVEGDRQDVLDVLMLVSEWKGRIVFSSEFDGSAHLLYPSLIDPEYF